MPKKISPLTDTKIRTTKPSTKAVNLYDGGGLFILITPAGGKLWRFKYRFGDMERRLTFGAYPQTTLSDARRKRQEARDLLEKGIDPGADRKAQKQAEIQALETFEQIAREWMERFRDKWTVGHSESILNRLEKDVFPYIGTWPMSAITPPEMLAVLRRIESRTLETAHKAKITCGQVFRYAIVTGKATFNPVDALRGALPPVSQAKAHGRTY